MPVVICADAVMAPARRHHAMTTTCLNEAVNVIDCPPSLCRLVVETRYGRGESETGKVPTNRAVV